MPQRHPPRKEREESVVATFEDEESARKAAESVREAGVRSDVSTGEKRDEVAALRGEMRDEFESMVAGPGNVGPFTKSMSRGVVTGVLLGGGIGILLGLVLGLLPWTAGASLSMRLLIGVVVGVTAGATVGFTAGGFVKPERNQEDRAPLAPERGETVGVHAGSEAEAERAERVLREKGPARIDHVDEEGEPEGPSSEEKRRPIRGG